MAKVQNLLISGTLDDLTFYVMNGQCFVKTKSSLTAEKVKKEKRFRGTMKSAGEFDRASRMASKVYQAIGDQKKVFMFRKLVSIGKRGLRDGIGEEEIARRFQEYLREVLNK